MKSDRILGRNIRLVLGNYDTQTEMDAVIILFERMVQFTNSVLVFLDPFRFFVANGR
jgi:hypothetical protein